MLQGNSKDRQRESQRVRREREAADPLHVNPPIWRADPVEDLKREAAFLRGLADQLARDGRHDYAGRLATAAGRVGMTRAVLEVGPNPEPLKGTEFCKWGSMWHATDERGSLPYHAPDRDPDSETTDAQVWLTAGKMQCARCLQTVRRRVAEALLRDEDEAS